MPKATKSTNTRTTTPKATNKLKYGEYLQRAEGRTHLNILQ
jgi:hypothetical protein